MKVTGFSFIKDAITYDYPIVESIRSILPLCDEFVVAVGKSTDDTLNLIQSIDKKVKILETVWDETLRKGGKVLALETDKAFQAVSEDTDWAFYIQGDEVMHEQYLDTVKNAMEECKDVKSIDGLLFKYLHFYGSYDYVGASSNWYRKEIRVIKNDKSIYSYKDAQGFRKENNEKLNVCSIDAYMYHYGWVKEPGAMQRKQENFHKYWHDDQWLDEHVIKSSSFDYEKHVRQLKPFLGNHPQVMQERIQHKNWKFSHDLTRNNFTLKDYFKRGLRKAFGIELGYKNYRIVRRLIRD